MNNSYNTTFGKAIAIALILTDANGRYKICFDIDPEIRFLPDLDVEEIATENGYYFGRVLPHSIHLFYGEDDGRVVFYATDDGDQEHGPDYHWSSNSATFNRHGYNCLECEYAGEFRMSSAVTLKKAIEVCRALGYGIAFDEAKDTYFIIDNNDLKVGKRAWNTISKVILTPNSGNECHCLECEPVDMSEIDGHGTECYPCEIPGHKCPFEH